MLLFDIFHMTLSRATSAGPLISLPKSYPTLPYHQMLRVLPSAPFVRQPLSKIGQPSAFVYAVQSYIKHMDLWSESGESGLIPCA